MKLKILQTIPLQSFYMSTQQCKLTGCGQAIQYVATFFCSFNVINSGLEYGWTSASFPILMKLRSFEITSEEGVWIATLPLPGAIIGSITNAVTCDIFGRKNMILFSCLPFTIHWILLAFANAAFVVYIARFLAGFASGVVLSAIPMYIGEISNAKIRGMLCGIAPLCIAFGVFLTNLMHLFLSITAASLLALVFPIGCFIGLIFMPESPYFYLMKNKEEKALRSMKIFSGSEYSESDFIRIKNAVKEQDSKEKEGVKALFGIAANRKCLYIIIILRAGQPLCGITTLVYYCSVILSEGDTQFSLEYSTLIFALALMISVLIGLLIIDSVGRRVLLLFSLFGSFIGLTTLAVYFHCKHSNLNLSSYRFVPLCCLIWIVLCYGVGLQQVPYVMQGELFTTGVKASAVCCGLIVFCAFSLSCSKYFQYMDDHFGAHFAFYTFAGFNVSTFFLVLFFIPETKNISLEDVQVLIKQKKIHFENVNMESSQR